MPLKELSANGVAATGPVWLDAITITSALAASAPGKVEVRDSAAGTGTVLLTLVCRQDESKPLEFPKPIPFRSAIHCTISGAGAGILVTVAYRPSSDP